MPYDVTLLCNLALKRIAVKQSITAIDPSDGSAEADACALMYEHARDTVLDAFPWPFAMKYSSTLAVVTDNTDNTDDVPFDWSFSYRYPAACIRVRRLIVRSAARDEAEPPAWDKGSDDEGMLIYTDQETPIVQYTAAITDPTLFSPAFADALIWRLAADLAPALSADERLRLQAETLYNAKLMQAQTREGTESQKDPPRESDFIASRA